MARDERAGAVVIGKFGKDSPAFRSLNSMDLESRVVLDAVALRFSWGDSSMRPRANHVRVVRQDLTEFPPLRFFC